MLLALQVPPPPLLLHLQVLLHFLLAPPPQAQVPWAQVPWAQAQVPWATRQQLPGLLGPQTLSLLIQLAAQETRR